MSLAPNPRDLSSHELRILRDDVGPHVPFVTYIADRQPSHGVFTSEAYYDERDRWTATALLEGSHQVSLVYLFEAGIVPDADGQTWAQGYTMRPSIEQY